MSLPELSGSSRLSSMQVQRAVRTTRRGQIEVFNHQVDSWVQTEKDRIDSRAVVRALTASLDAEVGLLDYGLNLADGNVAAVALVGRKVSLAAGLNEARISRRFGR